MDMGKLVGRDLARLGLAKGFTQKRFTEVSALRSDVQSSRVGPTHPTKVTHTPRIRHVEVIIADKKPRTKRRPPKRKIERLRQSRAAADCYKSAGGTCGAGSDKCMR